MAVVFIAQTTLQDWTDLGKVRLDDDVLVLVKERRQVSLRPAVRFTAIIGSDTDPNALVGKVKSKDQLDALKAEHYMDSVLLGDVAYTVVEGFLGDLMASAPMGQTPPPAPASMGGGKSPVDDKPRAQTLTPMASTADATSSSGAKSAPGAPAKASEGGGKPADGDDDAAQLSKLFLDTVQ